MTSTSNNNIARAIYEALKDKNPDEQAKILPKVVDLLARKRLLSKAPDILERLKKLINKEEGRIEAKVYTAKVLNDTVKHELAQALSKRYGGKEILIKEILNEKLLGGFRIEIDDEVADLSLRSKIKKLQAHLTHSI